MTTQILSALLLAGGTWMVAAAASHDGNWPQFRGPHGNGVVEASNLPLTWSESSNVKWKVALPAWGGATPIVWNDRVFVMAALKTERLKEGAEPDSQANGTRGGEGGGRRRRFGGGPPPSNYHEFLVVAYDRASGAEVWRTKVAEEVPHVGWIGRRTDGDHRPALGYLPGRRQHRGPAQAVPDQQVRGLAVAAQVVGYRDQVLDVGAEVRVRELAVAVP